MTVKRCRLMLENHTLSASSLVVAPGPEAGYPAANLLDPDRTKQCRVAGTTMTITLRLPVKPWVQALVLTGLDYPVTAKARLQGHTEDLWTAPAYDSGWFDAWPQSWAFGEREMGEGAMGGYMVDPFHRPINVFYIGQLLTYEYYRITIQDPSAAYIALGVAALTPVVELARNFTEGWKLRTEDTTAILRATNGQAKVARPGVRYDVADIEFKKLTAYDAMEVHSHMKTLGRGGLFFIAMHPESTSGLETYTTLYGRAADYSGMRNQGPDMIDIALTFEETP